jgi:hypothetical protein
MFESEKLFLSLTTTADGLTLVGIQKKIRQKIKKRYNCNTTVSRYGHFFLDCTCIRMYEHNHIEYLRIYFYFRDLFTVFSRFSILPTAM